MLNILNSQKRMVVKQVIQTGVCYLIAMKICKNNIVYCPGLKN